MPKESIQVKKNQLLYADDRQVQDDDFICPGDHVIFETQLAEVICNYMIKCLKTKESLYRERCYKHYAKIVYPIQRLKHSIMYTIHSYGKIFIWVEDQPIGGKTLIIKHIDPIHSCHGTLSYRIKKLTKLAIETRFVEGNCRLGSPDTTNYFLIINNTSYDLGRVYSRMVTRRKVFFLLSEIRKLIK